MINKRYILYFWLAVVFCSVSTYFLFPDKVSFSFLYEFSESHHLLALLIYCSFVSLRGLTFIPTTALTVTGYAVFSPYELFTANMIGIMASTNIVYRFSRFIGLDVYFREKYPRYMKLMRTQLRRRELPIIIGWSSFPFVSTDFIVYVCSTLHISRIKCMIGVFVGEAILNAFYILSLSMIF